MPATFMEAAWCTGFPRWLRSIVMIHLLACLLLSVADTSLEAGKDVLSPHEREWLSTHQVITVAPDPEYPPIEYFDRTGACKGIAADYLALLASRLGLHFEFVRLSNRSEAHERVRNREADMCGAAAVTPQRLEYLLFTSPFIEFPSVIIVRSDIKEALTLEKLAGSKVAVVSGHSDHEYVTDNYPHLELDVVPTIEAGLRRVSFGMADALVANLAAATYYTGKEGITNLRVAGNTGYIFRLAFACRKDWPELAGILEKGVNSVSQAESQALVAKWVRLENNPSPAESGFLATLLLVLGAGCLVLTGMFLWNWSLRSLVSRRTDQLTGELAERTRAERALKEARSELERRVDARTAQLSMANQRLWLEIVEREKIEEALRDSEERYRQAFKSNLAVKYLYDPQSGLIVDANEAACQYYGYSREEMTSKVVFDLSTAPEEQVRARIADLFCGSCSHFELQQRLSTGEIRDVEVYSGLVTIRNRKFVHSIIHDITDRKRFEKALHESEERFRTAAECASDLTYEWDLQTNLLEWYGNVDEHLGYAQGEFPRTLSGWEKALHPDDHNRVMAEVEHYSKTRAAFCMEYRVVRKDGAILHWTDSRRVLLDQSGRPAKWIGIATDITSRKRVEEELQAARQQYMDIIEFLPDATFVIDREGKVIAWNRAIEKMTQVSKTDILGKGGFAYAIPFYGKPRPILIDQVLPIGISLESQYDFLIKKGLVLYAEVFAPMLYGGKGAYLWGNASPLFGTKGDLIGAIESIRDITDRKKMEQEIVRAQKIESVGILAGGMAHDFNNLLGIILGNISLAEANPNIDGHLATLLKETERACYRAKNLTQQLLTFSQGGAPTRRVESIQEIIKEAADLAFAGSSVEWVSHAGDALWPVECDSGQIHQVFLNLMINAKEAVPEGGIVGIEATNEIIGPDELPPLTAGKYTRVAVRDSGMGIQPEHLLKIFDPYFSTKERGTQKGMGLGLAMVYSIIKKHRGHITVESQVGKGTTFYVFLPASEGKPGHQADQSEAAAGILRAKILLMDDEEPIREMASEMLCFLGCEVAVAHDGSEAIRKYVLAKESGKPFNIVILDITVRAGMGGEETIKQLLKIDPAIKVIASSGYSNDTLMSDYLESGFSGVLVKPYHLEELTGMILRILSEDAKP